MIKVGATIVAEFTTSNPTTGAAADADSLPTGVITRNGVDTEVVVTITNKATGEYKASFTLAAEDDFAEGDVVALIITAIIAEVLGKASVWQESLVGAASGATLAQIEGSTIIAKEATVQAVGGAVVAMNNLSAAQVQAAAEAALSAYSAAKLGDRMDLKDVPNATAITALQAGLLKLNTAIENTTIEYSLKCMMAMFNGDFVVDTVAKTITFKDRTGAAFSVLSVPDANTRTRIS